LIFQGKSRKNQSGERAFVIVTCCLLLDGDWNNGVLPAPFPMTGAAYDIERNFRLKLSLETWQFSYANADNHKSDVSAHVGVVGSF